MGRPRADGTHKVHGNIPTRRYNENTGTGAIKIEIDPVALTAAAETHASFEMLATIFGVDTQTIEFNPEFRAIIDKARATAKKSLLAAQFRNAIVNENATMQIWLGKQYLGQTDVSRVEQSGPDGKPIETTVTKRVLAVIPDNGRDPTGE